MDEREKLNHYVTDLFAQEDDVLRWIQGEAAKNDMPSISIQPFEGRMLQWLIKLLNARNVVEIGTLAGYSAVWMARALPPNGKLYTLEKSSKHTRIARESFIRAGVTDQVELLEGSAMDSLRALSQRAPFDLVFIDADKAGYQDYLAWAVEHLRVGGVVAAHNAFRGGRVIAPQSDDDRAMHKFNRALAEHKRLDSTILSIGDGMAVGIKLR
jgi:caffeoyl-CoA O-methyltransferase